MPHLKTQSGINWFYEVEGEGEPMLLLHGWGVNRRIWRQQQKHFSQFFQVVVLDLPGHGKSDWQKVTLASLAADINEILEHLKLDRVTMMGSSFGGLVAIKIAQQNPEKIRRLILVGSQPKFAQSQGYPYGLDASWIRKLYKQLNEKYPSMVNIFFRSLFTIQERQTRRFRWIQTFRKTDDVPSKVALMELLDIIENEDLRGVLQRLSCPIQFVYGDKDYICTKDFHGYMKTLLPKARFDSFAQCGHFPFLSKPYEFNRVVKEFLDKT